VIELSLGQTAAMVGQGARGLYEGARQAHMSGEEPVFVPDVQAAVALPHGLERVAALLAGEPSELNTVGGAGR